MGVRLWLSAVVIVLPFWPLSAQTRNAPKTKTAAIDDATARARKNLNNCMNGLGACDFTRLTPTEIKSVSLAAHRRNVEQCRNGFSTCDPGQLSKDEAVEVQSAQRRRNMERCLQGMGSC